jgi:PKD repeat protein/uncharacterized protein YjiK
MLLAGLLYLFYPGGATPILAQNGHAFVRQVRAMESDEMGISHPAGLAFSSGAKAFHVVEARAQGQPPPANTDIIKLTPFSAQVGSARIAAAIRDPINTAFDGQFNRLLIFQSPNNKLIEVLEGPDGNLDPTTLIRHDARRFGLQNPQGMTVDPASGHLFILDATGPRIVRIEPEAGGGFDNATISEVDLQQHGLVDPRGLAFDPATGHLHLLSPAERTLYQLSETGQIVATRNLSEFGLGQPQGMVFAPSGDATDDPTIVNLYMADSGSQGDGSLLAGSSVDGGIDTVETTDVTQSSGQIVELSFAEAVAPAASTLQSSLIQTIDTSQFSPPSPDAAGITYLDSSNTLLVADSEVNEMQIFTGDNLFEMTLHGVLSDTLTTISFSDEPTGVTFNPSNGHLFFSDDTGTRSIYEMNPGADRLYDTPDDIITSIVTNDFGSNDPEGVTFASGLGALFISDGVNEEVYRVTPGANGIFDGVPPAGDDQVTSFDTTGLGLLDPEGIAFNSDNGNLYVVGRPADTLFEVTTGGVLVQTIDVSAANAIKPAGLAYAPSSLDPNVMNIYIAARGVDNGTDPNENDGKVYEMALPVTQAAPVAEFSGTPQSGEAPLDVSFTDQSTNSPTSWSWDFGDGVTSTERNPSHTYSPAGSYTVTLTVSNALGSNTLIKPGYVVVNAPSPPVAEFTSTPTTGAAPLTVSFSDGSSGGPTAWAWDLGNGGTSTEQNPTHTYSAPGSYTVTLTVTNTLGVDSETKLDYIVVDPAPSSITFTPTDDAYVKSSSPTNNYGSATYLRVRESSTTYNSYLKFSVTGLGGAVESAKLRLYVTDGSDDGGAFYLVLNDRPDTGTPWVEGEVTWDNAPAISGSPLGTLGPVNGGEWVEFDVTGVILGDGVYSFGLTSGSTNSAYQSSKEGADPPELVVSVNTAPVPPVAEFMGSPTSGDVPLTVSFTDQSTGSPTSWDWDFGDSVTSTEQHPTHTYDSPGSYTLTLTVGNSTGSHVATKIDYITVTVPPPVADFSGDPTTGDAPLTVSFSDGSSGDPTAWDWDFGDGATSSEQNPVHTYTAPGSYTVTLTVTNAGGSDALTKPAYITVTQPPPMAEFTGSPMTGDTPLTVNFTDLSSEDPTAWAWDFGDGATSSEQNPVHTYGAPGSYTVTLTASNTGGSDTLTKPAYITVTQPPPVARGTGILGTG